MRKTSLVLALSLAISAGCSREQAPAVATPETPPMITETPAPAEAVAENPFFREWQTPFGAVPFHEIDIEHIPAALDRAMVNQRAAIEAMLATDELPTVANTLEVLERSSTELRRVGAVFGVHSSSLSNDRVRAIESEYAGKLARHQTDIQLDPRLFARVRDIHQSLEAASPDPEAQRLAERTYSNFVRAGAALSESERARVAELTQRQAELTTRFSQNTLRDTEAFLLVLEESDLDGLPDSVRSGAAQTAASRGHQGKYVFTLQRPDVEAFLTHSTRRDLREQLFRAFNARGDNGNDNDNNAVITELVQVRAERAQLLGFPTHAHLVTADSMAGTPETVMDLLNRVWEPALAQAKAEREALQALIRESGADHELEGWDWRFYAEKVRQAEYDLDPSELNPFLGLDNMLAAAFHVSERLFGVSFSPRPDLPGYHEDVMVFEVKDSQGRHVGLFYGDFFARQGKRSGAWMSSLRPQNALDGPVNAQVVNNLNIAKPAPGQPALISITEAVTLFHELGHGLHGLLSNVRYASLSGTSVPRDYVEFPAQFMEHYVTQPQVLRQFARHVDTGEPMPEALMQRFIAASKFNQGFATTEFLASGLVDQRYHALTPEQAANLDPREFERQAMAELGALPEIPMRHRSPHFGHIFSGGYSAAYYAYLWSEVLDADGFAAFEETGDIFDPTTAARLKDEVFSRGNTVDWMTAYIAFRGREPAVEALLRNRGLLDEGS